MNNKQWVAWLKLKKIAKELRGDWNPSWYNYGESKYYPIFANHRIIDTGDNGEGFRFWYVYRCDSHGGCSENYYDLVLQTEKQCKEFAKNYIDLWEDFILGY